MGRYESVVERVAGARFSYDLGARYAYWNAKAFGGELPQVPIRWATLKRVGGRVRAKLKAKNPVMYRITREADIEVVGIEMSDFLARDDEHLDGTLLHEMVHVYVLGILKLNEGSGGHGS